MDRRGKIFIVVFMTVAILLGAAWTIGPYVFEGRDHKSSLDSREMRDAATAACTAMNEAIDGGTPAVEAAAAMVAELRKLDPQILADDEPAEAWLDDWDTLLDAAREQAPIPRIDGARITRRMDDLVKDLRPCQVPDPLLPGRGDIPLD
jgi:hypothetical protein